MDFIQAFIDAGCIHFDKSTDHGDTLVEKYRV